MNSTHLEKLRSESDYHPTLNAFVLRTSVKSPVQAVASAPPMSSTANATSSSIYRDQKSNWGVVLQLYTEAIKVAAEGGLSKVEFPSYGEALYLQTKCYDAQKSLTTRALLFAARICRVVTKVFSIAALLFVVGAVLHSIAFPITMTKIVLALGLGVAGPGLKALSRGLDKAASAWINSFFNQGNKRELSILREWHKIKNLKQIEGAINLFFDAHADAMQLEALIPDQSKRQEWDKALPVLKGYQAKIEEYCKISPELFDPLETIDGPSTIKPHLFRNLIWS